MRLLESVALVLLLASAGCLAPPVEGPQIDDIPQGFAFDPNCSAARPVLPGQKPVNQRCYFKDIRSDNPDSVTISEYTGSISAYQAEQAYQAYVEKWVRCKQTSSYCQTAGELESVAANGHDGWGYPITTTHNGEQSKVSYTLIVPDEDRTYTVEVIGRREEFNSIGWARETACNFSVRYASDLLPFQIGAGLLALMVCGAGAFWLRRQQRIDAPERKVPFKARVLPEMEEARTRQALIDAPLRASQLRQRFASDPQGTLTELERLRQEFIPHPQLLHLQCMVYLQLGERERAVSLGREAWPVFEQREQFPLAVDLFHHLGEQAFLMELGRDQEVRVAGALFEQGVWQTASHIYGRALKQNPHDKKAAIGLIRIAENRLKVAEGAQQALQLYGYLKQSCQDPVLLARIEEGMARAGQPSPRV